MNRKGKASLTMPKVPDVDRETSVFSGSLSRKAGRFSRTRKGWPPMPGQARLA